MLHTEIILFFVLFIVAMLYSSVGHGGASGYLAAMALLSVSPDIMRSTALILNLFVAGTAFISFARAGFFEWKRFWPFAITSIPAAYIGANVDINPTIYKTILAIFLLIAIARMLVKLPDPKEIVQKIPFKYASLSGGVLGLLSGMIGIGGGIILSPLLILFRWSGVKQAAAISALFIFVNSASGLLGVMAKGSLPDAPYALWITGAFMGGVLGSYLGSQRLSIAGLTYVLAAVLGFAVLKLVVY